PASHVEIEQRLTQIGRKVLRMTASRFAAGSGRKEAVLLVMSDVTEERVLEEENRRQDQQMRWFLEQIKDYAIFTMDAECKATSWNQGVKEVLGYDEGEFLGHDIRKLIFTPEAQADGIPETEFSLAALDQRASDDRWMMRKGGEYFWASGITTSIRDDHDHLIGYSKVMRDLTSSKRAQDELSESAARLSEMDRRKNEFLATLAHELRNPLAPIKNAVQLMGMLKLDPELVELRLMMGRQVEQLVRLIDDLLDVSRISRGKISLRKEVIELKTAIDAAVESSATFISESGQQLTVSIDENKPIFVHADLSRLTQVISNLLNNSAKYSSAGCRIELSATLDNRVAVICVRDNGIGIAVDRLSEIFQMFAQIDDTSGRGSPGLGIGLTLVKTLVELHHGTVIAESDGVGTGSIFTVRLPATDDPGPQLSPVSCEPDSKPARSFRVLVVEDMRALREIMARLLRKLGHEVEFVESGVLALQKLEHYAPEVIFSDIAMPGMTGYELAHQIRQRADSSSIYLVALTGFGQSADREKALETGFDEHMIKPVDIVALQVLFEKLSTGHRVPE
ncbi:MAG: ATP-binding protein, partial [Planctomycetaceae bacterium]